VPRIVEEAPYNGASERAKRLGLSGLLTEVRAILTDFELRVKEQQDANGGAAVRRLIDERFQARNSLQRIDAPRLHPYPSTS